MSYASDTEIMPVDGCSLYVSAPSTRRSGLQRRSSSAFISFRKSHPATTFLDPAFTTKIAEPGMPGLSPALSAAIGTTENGPTSNGVPGLTLTSDAASEGNSFAISWPHSAVQYTLAFPFASDWRPL